MIRFVSKKERKVANARALKIVRELQKRLKPKYRIDPRLVGSARYNAVVCDDNGVYDMDYQLMLTCNCKCFDSDIVRKDFFTALNAIKNTNEKVENSTSVITVRVSNNSGKFTADDDKRLRDTLYVYLSTLEEFMRACIGNSFEDNESGLTKTPQFIKKQVQYNYCKSRIDALQQGRTYYRDHRRRCRCFNLPMEDQRRIP